MDRAGIPIKQTQTIAGHKSAVTTLDIYAKAYNEDLQDAVDSINIAL
jgi:integrase